MLSIRREQLDAFKQYLDSKKIEHSAPLAFQHTVAWKMLLGSAWRPLYRHPTHPNSYRVYGRLAEGIVRDFLRSDFHPT